MSGRRQIVEVLRGDTEKLDELYFQLGDVLDVKASIILVLVTLLGAVSGQVLALHGLSPALKFLQVISVLSLGFAVILTILALRISRFYASPLPSDWAENLLDWHTYYSEYPDSENLIWDHFTQVRDELTRERVTKNRALTQQKSGLNKWALRATTLALAFEFLSLMLLGLTYHQS
ncbi:MAG: hypothetical protein WA690_10880 [Candidatus Acidiferrales bacterium]